MDKLTIKDLPGPSIFSRSVLPPLVPSLPFPRPARTKAKVVPRAAGDVFDVGAPSLGRGGELTTTGLTLSNYMVHRRTRVEKGSRLVARRARSSTPTARGAYIEKFAVPHSPVLAAVQFQVFTAGSRTRQIYRPSDNNYSRRRDSAVREGSSRFKGYILPFRLFLHLGEGGGGGGGGGMRERRIGPLPSRDIGPASQQPDPKMEG